jgi:hypothetical protein
VLYRGQTLPDTWDVRVWESAGHRETSARRTVRWEEIGPVLPLQSWDEYIAGADSEKERKVREAMRDAEQVEKDEKNRRSSAKRAKTMCRRVIKTAYFDELLTITYRENQTDVDLFKRHFKEWVRRMKRALGAFEYCAGFEPQDRGAWHAHVSCRKLPKTVEVDGVKVESWRLGTQIWRSIVGRTADGKEGGMVFVGGKDRFGRPRRERMSCAKMAAYVSKYITKHAELFPAEKNRYSRSNGIVPGKPYMMTLVGLATVFDVLAVAFDARPGEAVVAHRAKPDDAAYWLCTELEKPPKSPGPAPSIYKVPRATAETAMQAWERAQKGAGYVA